MKAAVMKMVGTALLWVALASLINVPEHGVALAVVGFVSFASGLGFFAEGLKRDIVAQLGRGSS